MKKSVFALFLIFVLTFCFLPMPANAESFEKNAFRIVRKVNADESIDLSYIFPVNSDFMAGFSPEEINGYKGCLSLFVNALSKQNQEKQTDGVSVSHVQYFVDVDGIGFTITFDDAEAQKKFFGISEEETASPQTQKTGFFVQKTTLKTDFVFSSKKSAENFMSICTMAIDFWAQNQNISEQKVDILKDALKDSVFVYDYAITTAGLKSDSMYESGGYFHNVFVKTLDEIEQDSTITFYVEQVNRGVWYILALVVVGSGMLISFLILKRRKKI